MSNNIFANIGGDTSVSLQLKTNMRDLASFFDKNEKIKPEHLPSGNTVELDKIEKRIGTLEGTVAQSAAQVSALKDKVSEIDSLKTEISQIEKNVSERLTLFGNGFNSYNDEKNPWVRV